MHFFPQRRTALKPEDFTPCAWNLDANIQDRVTQRASGQAHPSNETSVSLAGLSRFRACKISIAYIQEKQMSDRQGSTRQKQALRVLALTVGARGNSIKCQAQGE